MDWPGLWKLLDPQWHAYPEREPAEPAEPTLAVLLGDSEPEPTQHRVSVNTDDTAGHARRTGSRRRNRVLYALDGGSS